jgi:SnoaL-like domain
MNTPAAATEESQRIIGLMYEAAVKNDGEALGALLAGDASFHEPPGLPYGGSYQGRENLVALFVQVAAYLDFATIKIDYILAAGENVITSLRIHTRTRRTELHVLEQAIVRNGKVIDLRIFPFDINSIIADKS